mmetsp:Transcript_123291/g.230493  ORF Transcript_123291/g.230493 Transcript_123291/m.230493 type:complete len:179 (-) Transcript_123291:83-619(-)
MTFSYKNGLAVLLVAIATLSSLAVRMQVDDQPMEVEVASRAEQKKPKGNASAKASADKAQQKRLTEKQIHLINSKRAEQSREIKQMVAFEEVGEVKVCCKDPSYESNAGSSNYVGFCEEECADSAECCGYKLMETKAGPMDLGRWECILIMHGEDTSGFKIPAEDPSAYKKITKFCKK